MRNRLLPLFQIHAAWRGNRRIRLFGLCLLLAAIAPARHFLHQRGAQAASFATITVNTTADQNGTGAQCSLREAIIAANTNAAFGGCPAGTAGLDTINFNLSVIFAPTINVGSGGAGPLPDITEPLVIDGSSAGRVELNGTAAGVNADGLRLSLFSGGSTLRALVINNFNNVLNSDLGGAAVRLTDSSNNTIQNCYLGTDRNGSIAQQNRYGIFVSGGGSNLIGGTSANTGNVISGNSEGIRLEATSNNQVLGNFLGTDATGLAAVGNSVGVSVGGPSSSNNNIIGGATAGARNVISGNNGFGIYLTPRANGNQVLGNYIGTSANGLTALANEAPGIIIEGGQNNQIGGTAAGTGNLISGNEASGIHIVSLAGPAANGNRIEGNRIGTNAAGTAPLPNGNGMATLYGNSGVSIVGATNTIVGGTAAGAGNLISGNGAFGVYVRDNGSYAATGNRIEGNFIGTNASGAAALANGQDGVRIESNANFVGGATAGARNVISGNNQHGVFLTGEKANDNRIQGNFIGTTPDGLFALGNLLDGIPIVGGANNLIGGKTPGEGNLISGNGRYGVLIQGGTAGFNRVEGNFIGTNVSGTAALGNVEWGVRIDAGANTIGRAETAGRNLISGNGTGGVWFFGAGATFNNLFNNFIGTNVNGTDAIPNGASGLTLSDGATDNLIGGGPGLGNVVSGHAAGNGILLHNAPNNLLASNFIGLTANGMGALPNLNGLVLLDSPNNTIGGTAVGGGNVVSGNNQYGIWIDGAASTGNQVRKNYVGTTANGLSALGNFNCGLLIGSADNVIGGMQAELGNIISGNVEYGLFINGPNAAGNQVQRNAIGVNANGAALGNGFDGVTLISCTGNTIGGAGTANVIAYNGRNGVTVASNGNTANAILNNALFANGALGIDLAPLDGAGNLDFGVTLNDPADGDSGPNSLRNFPVLSAAVVSTVGGNTMLRVQGVLNTGVSSTNTVQLYLNPACDPSGNGEGQTYLGQFTVTIPAGNVANFDQSLALPAGVGITPGAVVTATTSLTVFGVSTGTSEFSPCLPVQTPTLAVNDISVTEGNSGTTNATFTVTLNNAQGAPGPITVNYATADNTATAPGDYTALSGTLTFNAPFAQNTITQTITVPVVGDTTVEPDETFFLNLTAGSGAALADGQGQATIVNDDTACPTITLNPATLPGGSVGVFYSQTLAAAGGNAPYNFAVTSGGLPNGTALTAGGALTGTPALPGTFGFTVTATDSNGCTGARAYTVVIAGTGGSGLQFFPLAQPVRLLETRAGFSGCTVPGLPISAGGTLTISTQGSCTNIPGNAQAVTGNITVVPSGAGFLTLFPSSASQPTVANSNFAAGEVTNNVFTVGLGSGDGAFKIFANATTHVIVDVTGYYAPPPVSGPGGLYFHPLPAPVRLLETRAGLNGCVAPGAPLIGTGNPNADPNQDFAVQGRSPIASPCNSIPASAQMLVGNATTVVPGGGGYLTIYPSGGTRPLIASSNYSGNDIINGPFAVKLGADGKFKIYTLTTTHLVIDVLGYYSEEAVDANGAGLLFNPLPAPVRLLETRPGGLPLVGCTRTNAPIQGNLNAATHTQPARDFCGLPASAQAVVGNASVVNTARAGFLTLFPGNLMTPPLVATSNYPAPAAAGYNRHYFVGLSPTDGTFKVLTQATTELILDASGYFAP